MTDALTTNALSYLAEHHVMTLATHGAGGPWAAAVFYVSDGYTLYFLSSPRSRHARDVAEEPRVAATVQEDYAEWSEIRGVQLEGRVRELAGDEADRARDLYAAKFAIIGPTAPAPILAALAKVCWYELVPERLHFVDNSIAFGHRDEERLPSTPAPAALAPSAQLRARPRARGLTDARTAAHRLAMAPFAFQGARAARDLGLLSAVGAAGVAGAEASALAGRTGLPETSVAVLLDACLAAELLAEPAPGRWRLTTVGEVWLRDPRVAMDAEFTHAVCWHGLADLTASLREAAPVGLRHLGPWGTLYEGLATLPPDVRKAWFDYDHGHSDAAFDAAIALLREAAPRRVLDVGGNTGRFATRLLGAEPSLTLTLLDLPELVAEAARNLDAAGLSARSHCVGLDLRDHTAPLPGGHDAVWMSQFLDCFSPADVVALLARARAALAPGGAVWVLEVCPDRQRDAGAAASLRLASLYFTALANGVSRFYRASDLLVLAEAAGLRCVASHDRLGTAHTLFRFVA